MYFTRLIVILIHLKFVLSSVSDDEVKLENLCASPALERLDIGVILRNDRLVSNYLRCFMDEGPCSGEGKTIKKVIPEIMRTQCKNCNPVMARIVRKVMRQMFKTRPEDVKRFFAKYDPEGLYYNDLVEFMEGSSQESSKVIATS